MPEHLREAFAAAAPEEIRKRLQLFSELVVERLSSQPPPAPPPCPPEDIARNFSAPLAEDGIPLWATIAHIQEHVIPHCRYKRAPTYLAHIDLPHADLSIFAGLLIRALSEDPMAYSSSQAGTFIESQVVSWLAQLVYPDRALASGVMTSGGTQGTLQALMLLRNRALERTGQDVNRIGLAAAQAKSGYRALCVLAADTAHPCVVEAVRCLGLGEQSLWRLATDSGDRLSLAALDAALAQCADQRVLPLALVLTAGTSGLGAVDPLVPAIARARAAGVAVHVDAAHGAMALFSPRTAQRLEGIDQADTVILDPHKILGLNQGLGTLLVRDRALLDAMGKTALPYFVAGAVADRGAHTMDGTRPLNALGAWLLLRTFGKSSYATIAERMLALANELVAALDRCDRFEICNPEPDLNIVAFRLTPESTDTEHENQRNRDLLARLNRGGRFVASRYAHPSGRTYLRAVFVNPMTKTSHIEALVAELAALANS